MLERRELGRRTVDWRDGQRFESGVEMRGELWSALLRLPVEQRTVIVLRHVEDLSEDETAAVLNVRPGTVKSRLARGLATLRAELEGAR
jgi:RNA polymerase sigma factor (sigma-70 family)